MNAFKNRYGLIEIDLDHDRQRRRKKSSHWFSALAAERRLSLTLDDEDK
jgi:6-phospho-beta-glucosidase